MALGGLWEIVKGKGKAITPAPFWVWEGLATHTPAAAELAAQAADVASAARYFEVTSCSADHAFIEQLPSICGHSVINLCMLACCWHGPRTTCVHDILSCMGLDHVETPLSNTTLRGCSASASAVPCCSFGNYNML